MNKIVKGFIVMPIFGIALDRFQHRLIRVKPLDVPTKFSNFQIFSSADAWDTREVPFTFNFKLGAATPISGDLSGH